MPSIPPALSSENSGGQLCSGALSGSVGMEPPSKRAKCEHGRQRSKCKECGGSGICQHGRRRSRCKECGGASICQHGRQRSRCKKCPSTQPREKARIRKRVEPDERDEEEDGEISCTGGCKGKWSQYKFEELDWNQDPLAEDGLWHAHSSISECSVCLCIVYSNSCLCS